MRDARNREFPFKLCQGSCHAGTMSKRSEMMSCHYRIETHMSRTLAAFGLALIPAGAPAVEAPAKISRVHADQPVPDSRVGQSHLRAVPRMLLPSFLRRQTSSVCLVLPADSSCQILVSLFGLTLGMNARPQGRRPFDAPAPRFFPVPGIMEVLRILE